MMFCWRIQCLPVRFLSRAPILSSGFILILGTLGIQFCWPPDCMTDSGIWNLKHQRIIKVVKLWIKLWRHVFLNLALDERIDGFWLSFFEYCPKKPKANISRGPIFGKTYKEIFCKTSIFSGLSQSFQSYVTDMVFDIEKITNTENSGTPVEKVRI